MGLTGVLRLRWVQALVVLGVWFVVATLLKGVQTQELSKSLRGLYRQTQRESNLHRSQLNTPQERF